MEKRKNKILIGCLALLLVMAVGYALFSENITINGTATAQGDFDMTATCTKGWDSRFGSLEDLGLPNEGGYKNDTCVANDNEVLINVEFDYPGARRYFIVKMTNTGTIDAVLDNNDGVVSSGKTCIDGINEINGQIDEAEECVDINDPYLGDIIRSYSMFEPFAQFFENAAGDLISDEDPEMSEFIDENGNIRLKPGYSAYLVLASIAPDVDSNVMANNIMLVTTNISYSFNWKQVTAE